MNPTIKIKTTSVSTHSRLILFLFLLCLVLLSATFVERSSAASAVTYTVVNANDSGAGSLRQAILDANANLGTDTIVFNIAPGGTRTITVASVLPIISDPVIIDGTTQPGFSGEPLIVIDGINTTLSNSSGLSISSGNSLVRGLVIQNFQHGWGLRLDTAGGNTVQGNYIGVDATGTIRRKNDEGIGIFASNDNLIGGTSPAERNVVAGSTWENIWVGSGTLNNRIKGNFIGTNAQGTGSIGTGSHGVENDGSNTLIGGTEPGAGNLISGNGTYGVYLGGRDSIVQGNYIGMDVTGTQKIGNSQSGIYVSGGGGAMIGGTTAAARNIISGNSAGITYSATTSTSVGKIQGNYIGTDVTGMAAIPNGAGIYVTEQVVIGGTEPGAGNLISGNSTDGISINSRNSIIQGNLIGTNASGSKSLGNTQLGIMVSDSSNIIGGNQVGSGNVISGNTTGIKIGGLTTSAPLGNKIQGNFIGTDISGNYSIPNSISGIVIADGVNTIIGGINADERNVIAFNTGKGISVSTAYSSSPGNAIRGNSIFSNSGLGIDLGTQGVLANDPCDADTGANNLQNYPVLSSAASDGTTTNIVGSLNSTAGSSFVVDLFASPTHDNTGFGEGKTYIGSTNVTTANNCNGVFNITLPYQAVGGQFITATATDPNGNTSEFSQYVRAIGAPIKANTFDFDGDGKTDESVFRPADNVWYLNRSQAGFTAYQFGAAGDVLTPADFTGDGKTDVSVFRPSTGDWYVLKSEDNTVNITHFGSDGDIPVPGDFDGDGKADLAIYRPSQGYWYIQGSTAGFSTAAFGLAEDKPTLGDFDGDGKTDIAVYRPSTGVWYRLNSSNGSFYAAQFGLPDDKVVPADYTGDGKTDIAVWRPSDGVWYIMRSEDNSFYGQQFGLSGDLPAPGDYDGDGKADPTIFRPSEGNWYEQRSTSGFTGVHFGMNGDTPTPSAFVY